MEKSIEYQNKIDSMQKYVPLLTKAISTLEDENDKTTENTERIVQLKMLQQQLLSPKPGILLEDLNKCEQALKNLFDLQEKSTNETSELIIKAKEPKIEEEEIINSINSATEAATQGTEHDLLEQNENKNEEQNKLLLTNNKEEYNTTLKSHESSESSENKMKPDSSEDKTVDQDTAIEKIVDDETSNVNASQVDEECTENFEDNFFETENVEIIEFSENDDDDEDEDSGELIVPDDENYFIEESIEATGKIDQLNHTTEENNEWNDEYNNIELAAKNKIGEMNEEELKSPPVVCEKINDNEKIILPEDQTVIDNENLLQKTKNSENKDENLKDQHDEPIGQINSPDQTVIDNANLLPKIKNSENKDENLKDQHETIVLNTNEEAQSLDTPSQNQSKSTEENKMELKEKTEKRLHDTTGIDNSLAKKQKLLSDIDDVEKCNSDPLDMANKNNTDEMIISIDETDDVEIIEDANCPILIESDEDDKIEKEKEKPLHENLIKVRNFATKSTNPNKARTNINSKAEEIHKSKSSNSISSKMNNNKNNNNALKALKRQLQQTKIVLNKKIIKKHTPQTTFLSNIDLKPSEEKNSNSINIPKIRQITSTNPPCFKANLGKKSILIPNAFYSASSQNSMQLDSVVDKPKDATNTSANNGCTDAAHCRWLENFLLNFCSPRSIVHKMSYLLLKATLREDDYELIYRERSELKLTDNDTNLRMLRQLRHIFYVHGDNRLPKLTYVGRKFCQSAFVNIEDKTISLTTDSITNEVTSHTRITNATREAARTEKLTQNNSAASIPSIPCKKILLRQQYSSHPNVNSNNNNQTTIQNNSLLTQRNEVDIEYRPPREVSILTEDSTPRRSLRAIKLRKSSYGETDEDDNLYHNETNNEQQQQSIRNNDKSSFNPETEKFIKNKRVAANEKRQQLAKSFETAFIDSIPTNTVPKYSCGSKEFQTPKKLLTKNTPEYGPQKKVLNTGVKVTERLQKTGIVLNSIKTCSYIPVTNEPTTTTTSNVATFTLTSPNCIQKDSEVFVISDDEDKDNTIPLLRDEPRVHVIQKITKNVEKTINDKVVREQSHSEKESTIIRISSKGAFQIPTKMISNSGIKNISSKIHAKSIYTEICLICNRTVSRVVDHYVNSHPEHEVFTSRPSSKMLRKLFYEGIGVATYDRLQNGLGLYVATCVFCKKKGSFTLSYWYQHFALHTGEYAFECTGCGAKKPTRSQISYHVRQNCTRKGKIKIKQNYDTRLQKISAYTCKLCNYTQLNFANMVKHFHKQHEVTNIENFDWAHITLLDLTKTAGKGKRFNDPTNNDETTTTSGNKTIYVPAGDNEIFEINEVEYPDFDGVNNEQPLVINEAEGDDDNDDDEDDDFDVWSSLPYNSNLTENDLKCEINIE